MKTILTTILAAGLSTAAMATPTFHAVDSSKTSSLMHGGDRELKTLGFAGSSDVWGNANFMNWRDGRLTNTTATYGWNDAIRRDMNSSGNTYTGNPDRADNASAFSGEAGGTGRLSEVFGSFNGYKNMSWIIDGEDPGTYTMDLKFAPGVHLDSDNNANTIELAILERGGNSDLKIWGIKSDGSLTGSIMMLQGATGATGWTLDTLEIAGAQSVKGVGISLENSWDGLIGFRFQSSAGFNGPDIVAIGTGPTLVPAPGSAMLAGLGVLCMTKRRR